MAEPRPDESARERPLITVFGGTGFLGRRVVRHLLRRGFKVRIAVRQAGRAGELFANEAFVEAIEVDIISEQRVADALANASGAVNAVSLYRERGRATFRAVHVEAAQRVARLASRQGITRLIHLSGIGANPQSNSAYIRARGLGEGAVREALPDATLVRPAVMFGPDDGFLTALIRLLRTLPVYPLFGKGETSLQPVHVENVGEAIAAMLQDSASIGRTYEMGGPEVFTYAGLLRAIGAEIGVKPVLASMPYGVWHGLAGVLNLLPNPPVTPSQVELMEIDTVAAPDAPGLASLGIVPLDLRQAVRDIGGVRR
jgi:NADH dehydrogenase